MRNSTLFIGLASAARLSRRGDEKWKSKRTKLMAAREAARACNCQLREEAAEAAADAIAMFENLREDWITYERNPWRQGLWVMVVYRFGRWRYRFKHRVVRAPLSFLCKVLFLIMQILTGIELPCETKIGHRFRIDHFGGIIISGDAVFGDDIVIRNGVTVGLRNTGKRGSPVIGNRVDIGAGAKILGTITTGDDVKIGANAVVIHDVSSNSAAVGIPARIISRSRTAAPAMCAELIH